MPEAPARATRATSYVHDRKAQSYVMLIDFAGSQAVQVRYYQTRIYKRVLTYALGCWRIPVMKALSDGETMVTVSSCSRYVAAVQGVVSKANSCPE